MIELGFVLMGIGLLIGFIGVMGAPYKNNSTALGILIVMAILFGIGNMILWVN
jgi:hypothetical protein